MWILTNIGQSENVHYLICGHSLNVTRDGPGHIILKDKTVSKAHASICLTYTEKQLSYPEKHPEVILCDLKSTNGTYLQSGGQDFVKLKPNEPAILKHGDVVKFGRTKAFRLEYEPLIVTSSQISSKQVKEKLKECIKYLGAHLVKEWISGCSLLVMNDLVLTTKTVCALAAGVHIVTPEYLIEMIKAVKEKRSLPDSKEYLPVLKEPSISSTDISFFPDPLRRKLFCGKSFYFQNESSLKKMKASVVEAGGAACLLSEDNYNKVVCENNIFLKSTEKEVADLPKFIINCFELVKGRGLHPIPESDIGLAIVYCSTEKYCNPKFKISGILQPNSNRSQQSQKLVVYATETQQETEDLQSIPISRTTILESGESSKSRTPSIFKSPIALNDTNTLNGTKTSVVDSVTKTNKENFGKRKRSLNESNSPGTKTQEPKEKKKQDTFTSSATIEMTIDDADDNVSHFSPHYCSTERASPNAHKRKAEDQFLVPDTSAVKKSVRTSSTSAETHQESLDNSFIPKSIPFTPYTLPSINADKFPVDDPSMEENPDDIETQPFHDISNIKEEQLSQVQPPQPIREIEPQNNKNIVPNTNWIGGETSLVKSPVKIEPVRSGFIKPATDVLKQMDDEFALPCSSRRKRRNRSTSNELDAEAHASKRVKEEEHGAKNNNNNNNNNKSEASTVIKRSPSELPQKIPKQVDENVQPFISADCSMKRERPDDEVSKLGQTLERSLVVVEVVKLIKKVDRPDIKDSSLPSNGLPNFKTFRKIFPHNISLDDEVLPVLPRIIGGQDLFFHEDESSRKESFIATQPDLQEHLQMRESQLKVNNTSDDKFDDDFGLPSGPKRNRKGRW